MKETVIRKEGGLGVCGILTIIFVTLKVAQIGLVAKWSWWLVFAPMWIPAVFVLSLLLIAGIAGLIISVMEESNG